MDEYVRRVVFEVGPYSDKDTLPGGLLIFGSLNYLKMHIIIIITGLQVTSRRPCWCGEEQKHFSQGTLFPYNFYCSDHQHGRQLSRGCKLRIAYKKSTSSLPFVVGRPYGTLLISLQPQLCIPHFLFPLNSRDDKKCFARCYCFHYPVIGYFQTSVHCVLLEPVVLITINCLT